MELIRNSRFSKDSLAYLGRYINVLKAKKSMACILCFIDSMNNIKQYQKQLWLLLSLIIAFALGFVKQIKLHSK